MLLTLYSNQELPETQEITTRLFDLLGARRPTIGYIPSAPDLKRKYYSERKAYYSHFGASISDYVDLEDGFDEAKLDAVFGADAIHLSGGNTFRFQMMLKERNLFDRLVEYARSGGALIGVSAGAILLTANIVTASVSGDIPHHGIQDREGLNLVPFLFNPHRNGDDAEIQCLRAVSEKNGLPICSLRDDQGLIIYGDRMEIHGGAAVILNDRQFELKGDESIEFSSLPKDGDNSTP